MNKYFTATIIILLITVMSTYFVWLKKSNFTEPKVISLSTVNNENVVSLNEAEQKTLGLTVSISSSSAVLINNKL